MKYILLILAFLFSSCFFNNKNEIIGKWYKWDGSSWINFQSKKEIMFSRDSFLCDYNIKNDVIYLYMNGKEERPFRFKISRITDDSLIWESIDYEYLDTFVRENPVDLSLPTTNRSKF